MSEDRVQPDADVLRAEMLGRWERAAPGWGRRAQHMREMGMPVSVWMIDQLALQPGQRVLELACGPGDVGFLAAELIKPGGVLVCSDAAEAMLAVARERARELGIERAEFRQLQLEWIDLETASVDAILCRWAVMLCLDPGAALAEARRVLRPSGRIALAVWTEPADNPALAITGRALVELGYAPPPDPAAPGPFALSDPGRLRELLESAGFLDVVIDTVPIAREFDDVSGFLAETRDLSRFYAETVETLSADELGEVERRIESLAAPYTAPDGALRLPGRSLVAAASA